MLATPLTPVSSVSDYHTVSNQNYPKKAPRSLFPRLDIKCGLCYNTRMEIKNSTEWQEVLTALTIDLNQLGYNPDLNRMMRNIGTMVTDLSKAEVEARRIHNSKNLVAPLEKINKSIKHLEQFLLMARLMK